jgi:hypothetical protein
MIPEFTEDGLLPPGIYQTDFEDLEGKMGWSRRRLALLDGLESALELMAANGVMRVYLDGSFVTDKDRPNDIDGCYDLEESTTAEELEALTPIFPPSPDNRAKAKELYGVDFFPAAATELGSGQPFLQFFQKDRQGRERGVLVLEVSDKGDM